MDRYCFLDLDDVVVTNSTYAAWQRRGEPKDFDGYVSLLDPVIIERINVLGEAIGAFVVISSTWRIHCPHNVADVLKAAGLRLTVVGQTPDLSGIPGCGSAHNCGFGHRGYEIHDYIRDNNISIQDIVILDDNPEAGKSRLDSPIRIGSRFICTSGKTGLGFLDRHLKRALKLFGV